MVNYLPTPDSCWKTKPPLNILGTTFLVLSLLLSPCSTLADAKIVDVTTLTDYEPFTFGPTGAVLRERINPGQDSKDLKGFDWDIVRESFHAMGATITLNVVPWKRGVKLLENGHTDILFATTKTEQRIAKGYYFSKNAIHSIKNTLYVRANDPIKWNGDVNTLNRVLKGKKVGVRRGFSFGTWWDGNKSKLGATINEVDSDKSNFKKLQKKRLDFVLAYDIPSDYMLSKTGTKSAYRKIGDVGESTEYLATHKAKESVSAVNIFDEGFAVIKATGKLAEIKKKWGLD